MLASLSTSVGAEGKSLTMRRYIGKFNSVDLPKRPSNGWDGAVLRLKKPRPRSIPDVLTGSDSAKVTRRGIPQIGKGDELWICSDKIGPGICAVAQVGGVAASSGVVEIRLGRTISIKNPIKLTDFERLQSGSKVFGQLQRSRGPDLYLMKENEFEEFERVILTRKGIGSLPERLDQGEIIEPYEAKSKAGYAESSKAIEADPSIAQESYRMARLINERVNRGGEVGVKINPLRSAPSLSELHALLVRKWSEQAGRCALCGGVLTVGAKNTMLQPSADRIDSANGAYENANVAITHLACNLAKNKYSLTEFEGWLLVIKDADLGTVV